jgi:hypothetical protein
VIKVPNPDAATTLPVPENEPGRDNALPDAQDPMRARLHNLQAALVTYAWRSCSGGLRRLA